MFLLLILVAIFVSIVVRIVTLPFRYRRSYYGCDNPYRYGCRRHHRVLGRLLPILALVALDRIFTRRF